MMGTISPRKRLFRDSGKRAAPRRGIEQRTGPPCEKGKSERRQMCFNDVTQQEGGEFWVRVPKGIYNLGPFIATGFVLSMVYEMLVQFRGVCKVDSHDCCEEVNNM